MFSTNQEKPTINEEKHALLIRNAMSLPKYLFIISYADFIFLKWMSHFSIFVMLNANLNVLNILIESSKLQFKKKFC